jgi:hypothetical protein
MKNYLKIAVAALFLTTTVAMANDNKANEAKTFKMSMYFDSNAETIKTFFEKQAGDYLKVAIVNKEGQELTKTFFGKKDTNARLNLDISSLQDGEYTLRVSNSEETIERELKVGTSPEVRSLSF